MSPNGEEHQDNRISVTLSVCPNCGQKRSAWADRSMLALVDLIGLGDPDQVDQFSCENCRLEIKSGMQAVDAGGLAFLCNMCGLSGAIPLNENTQNMIYSIRKVIHGDAKNWKTAKTRLVFEKCEEHGMFPEEEENDVD